MSYLKEMSSLEKKASYQVSVNLCQDISFREVAMRLEKPTDGSFIYSFETYYFETLRLTKMQEAFVNGQFDLFYDFQRYLGLYNVSPDKRWDSAVDEQCERLTGGLPHSLKPEIHVWIMRIALEYSSYIQRQELLFGVSRYYLMKIITIGDWMEAARLDEKKLAKRMIKDEQLTILQRYRIACVYCLHADIPHLWSRLGTDEKHSISGTDDPTRSQEKNNLVLLWSYHMDRRRDEKVTGRKNYLWAYASQEAVHHGNQAALMSCWKRLGKTTRQYMVIHMASESLQNRKNLSSRVKDFEDRDKRYKDERSESFKRFNLPSYYSELLRFFLSKMNETQQLSFYKQAFGREKKESCFNVLNCFLQWPLRDHFLTTMNLLKGKIPKHNFAECFLSLAGSYIEDENENESSTSLYKKEKHYLDYGNLLLKLWEEMPENYREYRYRYGEYCHRDYYRTVAERFLFILLGDTTNFHVRDEAFFKQAWHHLPQEKRREILETENYRMCSNELVNNFSLVNWLVESLPDVEIPSFKKQFMETEHLCCLYSLQNNCYKFVEDLIDWTYESDTEKTQFKYEILNNGNSGLYSCSSLLREREFTDAEKMINFCLSSNEDKRQFKEDAGKRACTLLLKDCAWELIDEILAWSFDSEDKIRDFKKKLFYTEGLLDIHYKIVFIQQQWEKVKDFYQCFCLTPDEILKIKKETIFNTKVTEDVFRAICECKVTEIIESLRWCVTDEEILMSLREAVEKLVLGLRNKIKKKEIEKVRALLDFLVSELLHGFRK